MESETKPITAVDAYSQAMAQLYVGLMSLAGRWQDGSEERITLSQDGTTACCILTVGHHMYSGESFAQCITKALNEVRQHEHFLDRWCKEHPDEE